MKKITRHSKLDLSENGEELLYLSGSMSMTINNMEGVTKSDSNLISYSIEGVGAHISKVTKVDFYSVFRKKISLNSVGPNEKTITDVGKDNGAYELPVMAKDLPPGITEIYRLR